MEAVSTRQLIPITSNRNDDGPDSLEATIRNLNTSIRLPVLTLRDADRTLHSSQYAEEVIEDLIDKLLRIESLRATGRLYVP